MDVLAWLILRIVYAWMFLYPLKDLLKDWQGALSLTKLVVPFPKLVPLFTFAMLAIMLLGGLSILLGFYGQLASAALLVYCLMGARVHYCLANKAKKLNLKENGACKEAIQLAILGHVTSAQKNFVLAAVACFFILMGTGPYSLTAAF
jgi:uncharacterized membrane protein YphA (DoxX/SURF4 family)